MDEPQSPRVTALIVSRNDAPALRRCLEHLHRSTDPERLEILVIDDGSSDETPTVPADFPSVTSLRIPKRVGWTRAVNIALRTAKGDNVLLLPVHAAVEPDTISRLAERLESGAGTGAVCPSAALIRPFPTPEDLGTAWKTGELPGGKAPGPGETSAEYPKGAPIMLRRELLRAMNYLDARFGNAWSDLEMCYRVRSGGKNIVVLGEIPAVTVAPESHRVESDLEWTDSAHGIATWIGLHYGFAAGLKFRITAALFALGRGKLAVFAGILSGRKIDGNQE
jgi:GT2 family glycosyltransferase